jgi:hypothetical protein
VAARCLQQQAAAAAREATAHVHGHGAAALQRAALHQMAAEAWRKSGLVGGGGGRPGTRKLCAWGAFWRLPFSKFKTVVKKAEQGLTTARSFEQEKSSLVP